MKVPKATGARATRSTYSVVMKYLDNLIAWGDSFFRQDTVESVDEATNSPVSRSAEDMTAAGLLRTRSKHFAKHEPSPEPDAPAVLPDLPGFYKDRHYTEWVATVQQLKREARLDEAEQLLFALVQAAERENRPTGIRIPHPGEDPALTRALSNAGLGVPPWYYGQLAIIYRQRKDYRREVVVLERFMAQPDPHGTVHRERLALRLQKAQALLAESESPRRT